MPTKGQVKPTFRVSLRESQDGENCPSNVPQHIVWICILRILETIVCLNTGNYCMFAAPTTLPATRPTLRATWRGLQTVLACLPILPACLPVALRHDCIAKIARRALVQSSSSCKGYMCVEQVKVQPLYPTHIILYPLTPLPNILRTSSKFLRTRLALSIVTRSESFWHI